MSSRENKNDERQCTLSVSNALSACSLSRLLKRKKKGKEKGQISNKKKIEQRGKTKTERNETKRNKRKGIK